MRKIIDIGHIILQAPFEGRATDSPAHIRKVAAELVAELRRAFPEYDRDFEEVLEGIEHVSELTMSPIMGKELSDYLDERLEALYDWADDNDVRLDVTQPDDEPSAFPAP